MTTDVGSGCRLQGMKQFGENGELKMNSGKQKETGYTPNHINYALVEGTRPPMYSAMKYWGRKPHNIWNDYIDHYCPSDGVVLDPFVGSGITAFEAIKLGRKVIATDLNPLSSFVIEVMTSSFDKMAFRRAVQSIVATVEVDPVYQEHFVRRISGKPCVVYNYVWNCGQVKYVRAKDSEGNAVVALAEREDWSLAAKMADIEMPFWYPTDEFPRNPSINHNFISKIGGKTIDNLWTRRNLYVLSKLFDLIQNIGGEDVKKLLMYAFVHTLHLVSKMVVPRAEKGNRDFSGSWGRADYMIRNRSMEQNPLVIFKRSCFDRQGVENALTDAAAQMKKKVKLNCLTTSNRTKSGADVNYGTVDIADLCDYVKDDSVDFILTDPPYGGLVQYMDLSMVWLTWLQKFDVRFRPDSSGEITFKRGIVDRMTYKKRLLNAFKTAYRVLKPEHFLVVTFHNQDIREWNDFVCAIREAGFVFEKMTHQYNRRSGESNVANPYGTTGSDYYIRCKKTSSGPAAGGKDELALFVVNKTRSILTERGEPTPFEFLLNGLLPDMLQAGYLQPDEPAVELRKILNDETGGEKMFSVTSNPKNQGGDVFWFNHPEQYINHASMSLTDRVDTTIRALLRRKVSVKYDDVVAEIFKEFPNGQTPDPRGLIKVVSRYAVRSSGKWKLRPEVERDCTEHTHVIATLCKLAKKSGVASHVGNREKSESVSDRVRLSDMSELKNLECLSKYDRLKLSRIEMIDMVWVERKSDEVTAVFEVENSTDFIGAIGRASNIPESVPKFMIIPKRRVAEFLRYRDPLFVSSFRAQTWRYMLYEDVELLATAKSVSINQFVGLAKELEK